MSKIAYTITTAGRTPARGSSARHAVLIDFTPPGTGDCRRTDRADPGGPLNRPVEYMT